MRYTIKKCWGNRASVREEENTMNEPLAQRLRPKTLADVCGQQHLLAPGRVFRRTIESGRIPNMIFYGPSGTGKTTVARIIAENSGMTLHKLNGTSCGTGDIKAGHLSPVVSVWTHWTVRNSGRRISQWLKAIWYRVERSLRKCRRRGLSCTNAWFRRE